MYICIDRIKNRRGVYVEYTVKDSASGKTEKISAENVRRFLKKGTKIQGLKLSSDNRILLDTSVYDYEAYTGDELKNFKSVRYYMKERYGVKQIYEFCTQNIADEKICGVVGIRGTGKTISVLHTIDRLNDYNNTVYIEIKRNISMEKLITVLECYKGFKYVFIDEITRVTGFIEDAHMISSRYANFGMKIVISGTDSYAIQKTLFDTLCHRIKLVRMGYISFEEQNMLEGLNIDEYIKYGGILDKELRVTNNSVSLVNALVIDNIVNSIVRNTKYYKNHGLLPDGYSNSSTDIIRRAVRTSVFYIYYLIIIKSLQGVYHLRLKNYIDTSKADLDSESNFFDSIGVSDNVDREMLSFVTETLLDLGLIKKVGRYKNSDEFRYYITTPAIAYRLYVDYINYTQIDGYKRKTIENLFEFIVMCETLNTTREAWYYVEEGGAFENKEIDTVCCLDNGKIVLIEAKAGKKLKKCKKSASSLLACNIKEIGERMIVFREDFEEIRIPIKRLVKSDIKISETESKLVQNEVILLHFSQFKNVLKEIYNRNKSDEDDLLREDWDL